MVMETNSRQQLIDVQAEAAAVLDALNTPTPKHTPVAIPKVEHRTIAERDADARARLRTMGLRV